MNSQMTQVVMGCISVVAGASTMFLIYTHPEGLSVPAWIAYSACALFILVGLAIIVSQRDDPFVRQVLVVATLFGLICTGAWIALARGWLGSAS